MGSLSDGLRAALSDPTPDDTCARIGALVRPRRAEMLAMTPAERDAAVTAILLRVIEDQMFDLIAAEVEPQLDPGAHEGS